MSATGARRAAEQLILSLLDADLLLDYRLPVIARVSNGVRVSWPTSSRSRGLVVPGEFATIPEYRRFLRDQEFTAVLFDGAMLQLSWSFQRDRLVSSRFCYYPCPVEVDTEALQAGQSLTDLVDESLLDDFAGGSRGRNFFSGLGRSRVPTLETAIANSL